MKKITMKALHTAVQNDIFLKDAKVVSKTAKTLVIAYNNNAVIEFNITGSDSQFLTFWVSGCINWTICHHLLDIMEELENSVNEGEK